MKKSEIEIANTQTLLDQYMTLAANISNLQQLLSQAGFEQGLIYNELASQRDMRSGHFALNDGRTTVVTFRNGQIEMEVPKFKPISDVKRKVK